MRKTRKNATQLTGANCVASRLAMNFRVLLLTEVAACTHRVLLSDWQGMACRLTPNLDTTLPPVVAPGNPLAGFVDASD